MARRYLAALALVLGVAGCGEANPGEHSAATVPSVANARSPQRVSLHVIPPAGVVGSGRESYTLTGRVQPVGAQVVIREPGGVTHVVRAAHGTFRTVVRLVLGSNTFRVTARKSGYSASSAVLVSIRRSRPPPRPTPAHPLAPAPPTTTEQTTPSHSKCDP